MKVQYVADDGEVFTSADECLAHETKSKPIDPELARRQRDDFEFLVLCHAKGDPAMYNLLRDRSL